MMEHQSVLLNETIAALQVKPEGIYVDGTLGRGGHSKVLAQQLTSGHLYAFDKDETAIEESREVLKDEMDRITLIHGDFRTMKEALNRLGITKVDGVMMDLGVSSPQFDDPSRGFSYRYDARLDMRMDQSQSKDAWQVVNTYSEQELTRILHTYGEERYASSIARMIVKERAEHPVDTTLQLVDIIRRALPAREVNRKGHPAKKTFQALRIEVNGELEALQQGLSEAADLLALHGRLAVITFQSLEDRIVKDYFRDLTSVPYVAPKLPIPESEIEQASFALVTRKPVTADEEELNENHRAHSAKLRAIERTKEAEK
ncbi:MAG: 16S rRNA (cytosine(1402)-N(4))-methyltransferase RsmH [Galactobacillus timonensis]|jgi:16S rRNA (cytosine1402-N4)-methyltransferase|uniref:16S rRNA (cytosine(1402)-N(4))-methyltransferase RsmH n=2 Tax=Galactobacillus timonensis TaxID=2041840 RepID=UPI000EEA0FD3|nr:16S rRNA (cytosine(1402)-N(4))-methyltransferase RsmH [Galactobacillus timonensis]MDY5223399.1 16S rRNA (cytosine(1402)-N(4))-methyltransferase RsmH [Lachnospiraceae bacterium]MDY6281616.1 16S rRNA (cytosine(1402)-N(4))-methyltransferase RsmH [Erysipelotrichaceae bacterium]MCI6068504.1 16S rRNA (cytosine(1402)-N(4))-methyltransferase RsmH [Galactobacillus timonensis]MCI6755189.1 16S rRNA (cytosine(1402)-N(4))-methyltransferase RsmH [Galactobacillus timonensis]MDD7087402.1 16S rRNA (cytosine